VQKDKCGGAMSAYTITLLESWHPGI